jgi:hypothetical protein
MKRTIFEPDTGVEAQLKQLQQITGEDSSWLINTILSPTLTQMIDDGDTCVLSHFIGLLEFETKEDAMVVIKNYEAFVHRLREGGDRCYHPDAKPARTKQGQWEILFKSTLPSNHPLYMEDLDAKYQ